MTKRIRKQQYKGVFVREYGNSRKVHILMAEAVLGRRLPKGVQVHHVNEDWRDNSPSNLVVCPTPAYHKLLHRRTDALKECGNANWLKCCFCQIHDAPENIKTKMRNIGGRSWTPMFYHTACRTARRTQQREAAMSKAA